MKKIKIIVLLVLSFVLIIQGICNCVYADPGSSKGFADFDDNEAEKETQNLIQQQEKQQEVLKGKSNNNYLESLEIEGYTLQPAFDKQIQEYTLIENIESNQLIVNAMQNDSKAKVSGAGKITLEGEELRVDVTAENGTVRTYIVKINKQENNVNTYNDKQENETNINIENNIREDSTTVTSQNNNFVYKNCFIIFIVLIVIFVLIIVIVKRKHR